MFLEKYFLHSNQIKMLNFIFKYPILSSKMQFFNKIFLYLLTFTCFDPKY